MALLLFAIRYSLFAPSPLPLFTERANFEFEGPGAARLLIKLPIRGGDGGGRHQQIRIVERLLAPELFAPLAHPGSVDAGIDDQMCNMDVFRTELPGHRLCHGAKAELGAGKGGKAAAALLGVGARRPDDELLDEVLDTPPMAGADLAGEVSTPEAYVVPALGPDGELLEAPKARVAALDLGINAMTPHRMAERGIEVHVLPSTSSIDDVLAVHPDGVFFSNGPGDPAAATHEVELLREVLDRKIPFFGICYGNQILGRALGYGTYKLAYGHRGVNQPVVDRATGKVEITAHNHGFAVDAPLEGESVAPYDGGRYGRVVVSHVDLNDDVVEGLAALDLPAFSVQYHPEAAAGPHDAAYLFDRFLELMQGAGATPNLPTTKGADA